MVAHLRHGNARLEVRCTELGARTNAVSASSCALLLNRDRFGNRARNDVSSELPTKCDADDFIESLRPREFRLCCRAPAPPLHRDAPGAKCRVERLRVPTANHTNRVFSPSYRHQCLTLAPHAPIAQYLHNRTGKYVACLDNARFMNHSDNPDTAGGSTN